MAAHRVVTAIGAVASATIAMVLVTSIGLGPTRGGTDRDQPAPRVEPVSLASAGGDLSSTIEALQQHLDGQPKDATSWATLATAYVERARITGDPSSYGQADGAIETAVRLVADHPGALAASAALAAARHDFADALDKADAALAQNPLDPQALATRTDALTELGRYDEALAAATRADEVRPSVPTFTRLSYQAELRGDLPRATALMQRALDVSQTADDAAFSHVHLAQLAIAAGDATAARTHLDTALERVPGHVEARGQLAQLDASEGAVDAALSSYAALVEVAPTVTNLTAYGELLESLGREGEAEEQYAVVRATAELARANGANPDLELALFEADHGDPALALAAAQAEWQRHQNVHVADAVAWALHASGRDAEALAWSDRALALGSKDPVLLEHRRAIAASL